MDMFVEMTGKVLFEDRQAIDWTVVHMANDYLWSPND